MKQRILILGGGFGGLYAALELEKTLGADPAVRITLVNRENFFLFTPMLHEVAASDLDITTIVNPIRKLLRHTTFFDGTVQSIDLERKRVVVSHGIEEDHPHELDYDHLVLAVGSVTNFYAIPGLSERALTMKSLADALHLRNRLIEHLEEADFECCAALRQPLLTFVIAGGGFAGVETAAAINDFAREALKFYPNLTEDMLRIVLVEFAPAILPELGPELGEYARKKLAGRKIEFRLNTKVEGFSARGVKLSDSETIPTRTLVWTAGTAPNPLLEPLSCTKDRGRIVVNEFLEVPGYPGVWAVGDCASIPDRQTGRPYPPTAQHALRQGNVVARNIIAAQKGTAKQPFVFSTIGQLAAIGRRTGVAKILGFKFSGFIAWWLWRTIYLSKLPRIEKKLRVTLDWTLDMFFSKDLVQFMPLRTDRRSSQFRETDQSTSTARPSGKERFSPRQEAVMKILELLRLLDSREWIAVLLARLSVGVLFFESGRGKLFYKINELVEYFAQLGVPFPHVQAPIVASIEFVGGICLILGIATRVMSAPLAVIMAVAILTAQLDKAKTLGDFLYLPEVLLLVIFIWLIFSGPGKFALDNYIARKFLTKETINEGGSPCPQTGSDLPVRS